VRYAPDNLDTKNTILNGSAVLRAGIDTPTRQWGDGDAISESTPSKQRTFSYVYNPPGPAGGEAPTVAPFLVGPRYCISQPPDTPKIRYVKKLPDIERENPCSNWRTVRGTCPHGAERWVYIRCKRRDCDGCSAVRKWKVASRISDGIRRIGVQNCAFVVLTYADDSSDDPDFKEKAVKLENSFVKWVRKFQKNQGIPRVEYAKTWELQPGTKRIHTNIVFGPWKKIPWQFMLRRWGSRMSITWVKEDQSIAREATKALSPDGLSSYMAKLEQMVTAEWKRAVSFSRGWPKVERFDEPERIGEIKWDPEWKLGLGDLARFQVAIANGWWGETSPGSGEFISLIEQELCDCFEYKEIDYDGGGFRAPPARKGAVPTDINFDNLTEVQRRELENILE